MSVTLLVEPARLNGGRLRAEGDSYRHLFRARRLKVGDELRLVDGEGRARRGRVIGVDRSAAEIELLEAIASNEPRLSLEVVTAVPRPPRVTWMVEKCTELGVVAFRFLASERAVRPLGRSGLARLRRVARAAVEQSQRSLVPELSGPHVWEADGEGLLTGMDRGWFLDAAEGGREPASLPQRGRAILLVGPEGGWSAEEKERFRVRGLQPLALGPRTLRTETAAVAGAALFLIRPGGPGSGP